jgi:YARHG domain
MSRGLARMDAPAGTLIAFATQPGNVAQDGTDGDSPYAKALAATLGRSALGLFDTFNEVGLVVDRATGHEQVPWFSSSPINGDFRFASVSPGGQPPVPITPPPIPITPPPIVEPIIVPPRPSLGAGFIFPDSDRRRLSISELSGRSVSELRLARNEIYARRGRMFDSPDLQAYFARFSWYQPRFRDVQLSAVEQANVALLLEAEQGVSANAQVRSDFMFPDSDRRLLSAAELGGLTRAQLRIARNEIFARRGRIFDSEDLRQRFAAFPWYRPSSRNPSLNAIERQNVDLIQRAEQRQ